MGLKTLSFKDLNNPFLLLLWSYIEQETRGECPQYVESIHSTLLGIGGKKRPNNQPVILGGSSGGWGKLKIQPNTRINKK